MGLNPCFWKSYHHIHMHFVHQFQCFELFLIFISKTVFFLKFCEPLPVSIDPIYFSINRNSFKIVQGSLYLFRLIQSVFRSIEIVLKILRSLCLFRSIKTVFSINWNSWIRFLKNQIWLVQTTFSKPFQNFISLSDSARLHRELFVVFLQIFC